MSNKKMYLTVSGAALVVLSIIGISNAITKFSEQSSLLTTILIAYSICFFLGVSLFVGAKQARMPAIILCLAGAILNTSELFTDINQKDIAEAALFIMVTFLLVWDWRTDV